MTTTVADTNVDIGYFLPKEELSNRIRWLLNLRWFAVIGLLLVITGAKEILKIDLPMLPLYAGNAVLMLYNTAGFLYFRRLDSGIHDPALWFKRVAWFVNLQITVDLLLLLYLIYFSGGIENPFIFFFVFHMVIASILLSKRAAYIQASLIGLLFCLVLGGESLGVLPHYHLAGYIPMDKCAFGFPYFAGKTFVFLITLYITVYMATIIIQKLRKQETDLETANSRLEEQDRIKSQYVYTVSHDIKGSLGAVQGLLKVVLDGLAGAISEKARSLTDRAEKRVVNLLAFVDDLLKLSEIRAAKEIAKEVISISTLLDDVIQRMKDMIDENECILKVRDSCSGIPIKGNRELLEETLVELISNAVKYTPQKGKITVASHKVETGNTVRISVTDTGIGIPDESTLNIYNDFYRTENARRYTREGTGLGLSIAKTIITAHNGKLWVESKIDEGSTFFMELPVYSTTPRE